MRVLLIEDEASLAIALSRGLRREGFGVDWACDGEAGLEAIATIDYDVVVLDRDLPGIHGDDVCRQIVNVQAKPRVLMLTASASLDDVVEGLAIGADDYLGKPFAFRELVARIQALGRRIPLAIPPKLRRGDLELDWAKGMARRSGVQVDLTAKEAALLQALLTADGAIVSAEQLLEQVWDENANPFTNSVRVIVGTLRRKLGEPAMIETVIGRGYVIR